MPEVRATPPPGCCSAGSARSRPSPSPSCAAGHRGAGSEFLLARDMRFASRENAVLAQPEVGIGTPPGAGAVQHLTRLLGRGRSLEAVLTSADFELGSVLGDLKAVD
ncbi:enoyl-CoA hydratase-related protein [Streptomyces melanosporofaciens]|uniref:enoyl-CoA hydratase-related protein n=1 Tax=Streptomyces melanosporofaciens TaxID=67327 RepID=UPI00244EF3B3|nr:enoyl-CoA hydratase-related protein [Streptomyces melanosporofaciens]